MTNNCCVCCGEIILEGRQVCHACDDKTSRKPKKEPKPILLLIAVKEKDTGSIVCMFPPTSKGERQAERYRGLAGLEIVKTYEKGGIKYESN